jgi:hypothetical protein
MTSALAHSMQAWFTSHMSATKTRRESTYEKAQRLVADGRYTMDSNSTPPDFWVGACRGDHGIYAVFAISPEFMEANNLTGGRAGCTCQSGFRRQLCSHAQGAEELRLQGGSA